MLNETPAEPRRTVERLEKQSPTVSSISLPKGGGVIRGMGEKLAANPLTGTGSMTVPIATSPGRCGFGPHFAFSCDSGSDNVGELSAQADLCILVGFNRLGGHYLGRCRLGPQLPSIIALGAMTSCETWPKSHLKVPSVCASSERQVQKAVEDWCINPISANSME